MSIKDINNKRRKSKEGNINENIGLKNKTFEVRKQKNPLQKTLEKVLCKGFSLN